MRRLFCYLFYGGHSDVGVKESAVIFPNHTFYYEYRCSRCNRVREVSR